MRPQQRRTRPFNVCDETFYTAMCIEFRGCRFSVFSICKSLQVDTDHEQKMRSCFYMPYCPGLESNENSRYATTISTSASRSTAFPCAARSCVCITGKMDFGMGVR